MNECGWSAWRDRRSDVQGICVETLLPKTLLSILDLSLDRQPNLSILRVGFIEDEHGILGEHFRDLLDRGCGYEQEEL